MMRQAGRYLPEYREVRNQAGSFLNLCYSPELATEVTLQPLRRFDLDAAILFADILLLPQALGQHLEFRQNEGPVLDPVRSKADLDRLQGKDCLDEVANVFATVRQLSTALPDHVALIGFCGAPWTVATYMVEGGTSAERARTRVAAHGGEGWFDDLIDLLVKTSIGYLCRQVEAGAEVLQVFDTWAGDLPDGLCDKYCFGPIARIVEAVKSAYPQVPVIGFARGIGSRQLEFARATGVDAVGLEWAYPVERAAGELQPHVVVQGNVDPLVLLSNEDAIERAVLNVVGGLDAGRHIMNLGHGIKPETPVEHVDKMIATVRDYDAGV